MTPPVPLDSRKAPEFLERLLARSPGYLPGPPAPPQSPGRALLSIAARYLEAVVQRFNQAPEKHKLAFLDLLGVSLLPAQSARAPMVFQLDAKAAGGIAPAGTQVGAPPPPGTSKPVVFETERAAAVTAGQLKQVFSLWPGRDEYIDHSADFTAGLPVLAFRRSLLQPTPHVLYVAHDVLLALSGNVRLSVAFELTRGSAAELDVLWEYWDGEVWRGFLESNPECMAAGTARLDGTVGLTESGSYTLIADGAKSVKSKVNGVENFWLRGRLTEPLPANPEQALPEVESIKLASTVNQTLRPTLQVQVPVQSSNVAGVQFLVFERAAVSGQTIYGTVMNAAGDPVSGAEVTMFVGTSLATAKSVKSAKTGTDGGYLLPGIAQGADDRFWFRVTWSNFSFEGPDGAVQAPELGPSPRHEVRLVLDLEGLLPDQAFADATSLDLSKPFYPMGQAPLPGTTFYFTSEELFSKPGAQGTLFLARTRAPQDLAQLGDASEKELPHQTSWEYWNGHVWAPLAVTSRTAAGTPDLNATEVLDFEVPEDFTANTVNGKEARWIRMRLTSGSYGYVKTITSQTGTTPSTLTFTVSRPPVLAAFRMGYTWQFGPFFPQHVITYNDFAYEDRTYEATWPGTGFFPYRRISDQLPALYLGFDKKPPSGQLGMYFDIVEDPAERRGPALAWEYWDGFTWRELPAEDENGYLRRPGIAAVLTQPDDTALARFGTPLNWVRARLKEDGPPGEPEITAIYPNAVWAAERQTLTDVPVGASTGLPRQSFNLTQTPILAGEILEVRELSGPRANVEWRLLAAALFPGNAQIVRELEAALARQPLDTPLARPPLRLVRDRRARVTEAWVTWNYRKQLFSSAADARDYTIDRAAGRVDFGDGVNGMIPPLDAAIVMRRMATGGGLRGNVAARAATQLLGTVPGVQSVFNARPGEGGANAETLATYRERAPQTVRHRGRAIAAADYEVMAREASTAVAFARALPARAPGGIARPGWVTLIIVPASDEPRPYPSFGMCELVRHYIEDRACTGVAAAQRIAVVGPQYDAVDIEVTLAPLLASEAAAVEARTRKALQDFLQPVKGGPGGQGWALGRDVYLSDVAAVLEAVDGVDYVVDLALLRDGVVKGERFDVRPETIAAYGSITIHLRLPER